MAVEVVLEGGSEVAPGEEVRLALAVTNTGTVVDEVQLSVLGDAEHWAAVHPARLVLFPGDTGNATLRLSPPLEGGPPAGPVPLGVLARSVETNLTAVGETTVTMTPSVALDLRLVPVTSFGRRRAAHTLVVRNLGNAAVPVSVEASDPDQLLELHLEPRSTAIGPGGEATFAIRLRSSAGRDAPRVPFTVTAATPGVGDTQVTGTFVHRRRRALLSLLLLASVVLAAAVLLLRSGEDSRAVLSSGGRDEAGAGTTGGSGAPSASDPGAATGDPDAGGPADGAIPPGGENPPGGPGGPDRPAEPGPITTKGTTPGVNPTTTRGRVDTSCSNANLIPEDVKSFEVGADGLGGWTKVSGSPRTVAYGEAGYVSQPIDWAGPRFAFGGPGAENSVVAILEHVASLAPCPGIAAGGKVMNFGGYMGGYEGQEDTVNLVVSFRAGSAAVGQSCTLRGPTAADRGWVTKMVERGATPCPIPTTATAVVLQIHFTRAAGGVESDGSYENAYLWVR